MKEIGINGFGRIGRTSFRVWWQFHRDKVNLSVINTSGSMPVSGWAHLLKYDSNYGPFLEAISYEETQSPKEATDSNPVIGTITIGDRTITITAQRDPAKIPWAYYNVDTVIESTGAFVDMASASKHLQAGAQRVIITAPAKDDVGLSVLGVRAYDDSEKVVSNASCTTNCVAPVMAVMESAFGIEKAMLTTVHSFTDDQNTHDNSHKDLRRARSASQNIIPTSTGAAVAVTKIIPSLEKKFDGLAIRVPTPTGSLSDMVFVTKRETTIEEVNQALTQASQQDHWKGILAVTNDPIVSSDIVGRPESSIVDLSLTNVIGGNLVKVISWYDNEWGYCNRLLEQVR